VGEAVRVRKIPGDARQLKLGVSAKRRNVLCAIDDAEFESPDHRAQHRDQGASQLGWGRLLKLQ
jgi:hypothetical protein